MSIVINSEKLKSYLEIALLAISFEKSKLDIIRTVLIGNSANKTSLRASTMGNEINIDLSKWVSSQIGNEHFNLAIPIKPL